MNQDIKTRWLSALRSGEYKQGREELRTFDGEFCCLGVLCDIIDPTGWDGVMHREKDCYPTQAVLDIAGITDSEDADAPDGVLLKLTTMNDDNGNSFSEIADWIEVNL